jgi:hypothetical protein
MESVHEEWRPLAGRFSGWPYEVSSHGRVRRSMAGKNTFPGRLMSQSLSRCYPAVVLRHDKRNARVRVHRLVAEAFIPRRRASDVVNHLDGNKCNCRTSNLEWCSHFENRIHAIRTGLSKPSLTGNPNIYKHARKNRFDKLTFKAKLGIVRRYAGGESVAELAAEFSRSPRTISGIISKARQMAEAALPLFR